MKNVDIKVKGNQMTITVDLTKNHGLSQSGKTQIIGTTSGNHGVDHEGKEVMVGLNVYRYAQPKTAA